VKGAVDEAPAAPSGARHFAHQGPSRRWMTVFGTLLALAAVTGALLAMVGIKTVRESRAGKVVATVTDPSAPGFEAFLEPTPTLALLHRDGKELRSIAVLALRPGDAGGSALLVSPSLRSNQGTDAVSFAALSAFSGGPEMVMPALQTAIRFGVAEVALVDDARWTELVEPVAPLSVDNPSAAGPFPEGPFSLAADQVGAFLSAAEPGERPEAVTRRQRAFYRAWVAAVAASSDPAVIPGEIESGVGRFVRGLAAGSSTIEPVPVAERPVGDAVRYDVDREAMEALVPDLVPFPTAGSPGTRIRVRLLDGTGDGGHVEAVAPLLVPAGVQIVVVGNADRFDYDETQVRYHTPVARSAAEDLVAALGSGRAVDDPRQTDTFDVTIVLGNDL
jgi:hypothetical protein